MKLKVILFMRLAGAFFTLSLWGCSQPGQIALREDSPSKSQNPSPPSSSPGDNSGSVTEPLPPVPGDSGGGSVLRPPGPIAQPPPLDPPAVIDPPPRPPPVEPPPPVVVTPPPPEDPPPPPPRDPQWRAVEKVLDVRETTSSLDILVVIDNSKSMAYEQRNMAQRFKSFLDQLKTLDWKLSVTTTDMEPRNSPAVGDLIEFVNPQSRKKEKFIHSGLPPGLAQKLFAQMIERPETGSSFEQGLSAAQMALSRHRGEIRNSSALSVVLVSDSDETVNPKLPDDPLQHTADGMLQFIQRSFGPQKKFVFHSIIVKENDSTCLARNNNENYGRSYAELSKKTQGIVGSVCEKDYGSQLKAMGQRSWELVHEFDLGCSPKDLRITGPGLPSYEVRESRVLFAESLSPGSYKFNYLCQE